MQQKPLDESEIIRYLTGPDDDSRKKALRYLFGHTVLRPKVIGHVRRYGGNRQDGEDVFQEAVIVFDRKLRQGAYQNEGSLEAYFMGIVRWHWFNELQRRGRSGVYHTENPPEPPPGGNPETEYLLQEQRELLEGLMRKLTEKCRSILKMYQLDYSMDEIGRLMGYAGSGVAKKETHLCRQRFKALLAKTTGMLNTRYHEK